MKRWAFLGVIIFGPFWTFEQGLGEVYGMVRDQNGKPMQWVTITARLEINGIHGSKSLSTLTDEKGWYSISFLPPGKYEIMAESFDGGFCTEPIIHDLCQTWKQIKIKNGKSKSANFVRSELADIVTVDGPGYYTISQPWSSNILMRNYMVAWLQDLYVGSRHRNIQSVLEMTPGVVGR